MKKTLKTVFIAVISRWNFEDVISTSSKEFDTYPNEEELLIFLNERNQTDPRKDYITTMRVEKIYQVVNDLNESNEKSNSKI